MQGALRKRGIPFRAHPLYYDGQPDIEIAKLGIPIVIFVDGDYYHGHKQEIAKRTGEYATLVPNDLPMPYPMAAHRRKAYDARITRRLRADGVVVFRFWESEILNDADACAMVVEAAIAARRRQRPTRKRVAAL